MSSDADAESTQNEAPAPSTPGIGSNGSSLTIKKRKKDGPKPIITMEGPPPPQRPTTFLQQIKDLSDLGGHD
ncbi:hypothetical protein V8C37DRAFT_405749 [Trichoderma ceciliae]